MRVNCIVELIAIINIENNLISFEMRFKYNNVLNKF
jgi:hypothetical protein